MGVNVFVLIIFEGLCKDTKLKARYKYGVYPSHIQITKFN